MSASCHLLLGSASTAGLCNFHHTLLCQYEKKKKYSPCCLFNFTTFCLRNEPKACVSGCDLTACVFVPGSQPGRGTLSSSTTGGSTRSMTSLPWRSLRSRSSSRSLQVGWHSRIASLLMVLRSPQPGWKCISMNLYLLPC